MDGPRDRSRWSAKWYRCLARTNLRLSTYSESPSTEVLWSADADHVGGNERKPPNLAGAQNPETTYFCLWRICVPMEPYLAPTFVLVDRKLTEISDATSAYVGFCAEMMLWLNSGRTLCQMSMPLTHDTPYHMLSAYAYRGWATNGA